MEDMKYLGLYDMKVSVGIHGMEEPEPFRVNTWNLIQEQVCMCWQDMRMKVTGNC